jgi:hypothetical protein
MADDSRKYARWAVAEENQYATLRDARRTIAARLMNTSIGGFSVQVAATDEAAVALGEQYTLAIDDESCQVRVLHLQDVDDCKQLGLERVSDTVGPRPVDRTPLGRFCSYAPQHRGTMLMGLAFVLLFVGMIVGRDRLHMHFRSPGNWFTTAAAPRPSLSFALAPEATQTLSRLITLESKESAHSLRLSPRQQEQIGRVLTQTGSRVSGLRAQAAAANEQAAEAIGQAQRQVLEVLDANQAAVWAKQAAPANITAEPAEPPRL